jgi:hypothetical protein
MDTLPQTGKNDRRLIPPRQWVVVGLIALFVFNSFLADLWPAKNIYFLIFHKVDGLLTMELPINAAMRYSAGHTENSSDCLPYVFLLKSIHICVPGRLAVLRIASVLSALVALIFLFRVSKALFGWITAVIFLFLLVTSPVYLEGMRSFGFIPFTAALAAISIDLLFSTLGRKKTLPRVVWLAGCSFLMFSGYAVGRLAVIFPLAVYGLYWRENWRKLILYVGVLVMLVLVLDLAVGDLRFDIKDWFTVGTEWMDNRSQQPLPSKNLPWVLKNTGALFDYIFQQGRTHFKEPVFDNELAQSRIFNPVYTPFFLAGIILCLVRRKRNQVLLLLWYGFFVLLMLPSSELAMRRLIFALPPFYLLIAIGLWGSYQFLNRLARSRLGRKILLAVSLLFLLATGGYDLREFFFTVSRPICNYTSDQLKATAEYIEKHAAGVSEIIIDGHPVVLPLTWGNPFFDPRIVRAETARKIVYEFEKDLTLREQIERAKNKGTGALFLYPFFPGFDSRRELSAELKALAVAPPPEVSISRVPGVEMWGVVVKDRGFRIPSAANRSYGYALPLKEQRVAVSSEYSWDNCHRHLLDGRAETYWKIAPPEVGEPAWVFFDLGGGGARAVRSLAARPRADRPEEFFHHATLRGSQDGQNWENVSRIVQEDLPRTGGWIYWDFDNEMVYRFYKLEIKDGYAGREKNFISLAELKLGK